MKHRTFILSAAAAVALALPFTAAAAETLEVFKSASCGCCAKWVEHLQKAGFTVKVSETEDVDGKRRTLGMPEKFASCHTARIGNYLVEGHVPAADIKRLLKEKPKALGVAVPGMPPGSPGMDIPSSPPYQTLLVQGDGSSQLFARH